MNELTIWYDYHKNYDNYISFFNQYREWKLLDISEKYKLNYIFFPVMNTMTFEPGICKVERNLEGYICE